MEKQNFPVAALVSSSLSPPPYDESNEIQIEDLQDRLDRVQLERIRKLTETHINGLVDKQLAAGLSKGVFAFIPSDVSLLQLQGDESSSGDSLLSFSEGEFPYMIRLEGEDDTSVFWKQPRVIQKLEQVLKSQLRIEAGGTVPSQPVGTESNTSTSRTSTSWRFMRRQSKPEQPRPKQTGLFSQAGAGWKAEDENKPGSSSTRSLRVDFQEVTVRIQSDLGLYQTRSCPAVVVRLRLGS